MKVNIDDVIGMAWSDKISFEEIKKRTGLKEAEVISIMRNNLKKNSYILWRKRVPAAAAPVHEDHGRARAPRSAIHALCHCLLILVEPI